MRYDLNQFSCSLDQMFANCRRQGDVTVDIAWQKFGLQADNKFKAYCIYASLMRFIVLITLRVGQQMLKLPVAPEI